MDCLDVLLEISWFSIRFCTIIIFVFCYVFHDWYWMMKRYFCKCQICNFFCLHEHSWCESSNFVLEWRIFHKNHIRISFVLQICHLSVEFSTGITFMISLSLMDNLDKIHLTCWFSDIFSTWNTFVISLSSMNSHNVLI